jgi:hypothetical protein
MLFFQVGYTPDWLVLLPPMIWHQRIFGTALSQCVSGCDEMGDVRMIPGVRAIAGLPIFEPPCSRYVYVLYTFIVQIVNYFS